MKPFLWALLPLGALIVLLLFNLTETDQYEFGVETPPAPGNNVDAEDAAFVWKTGVHAALLQRSRFAS